MAFMSAAQHHTARLDSCVCVEEVMHGNSCQQGSTTQLAWIEVCVYTCERACIYVCHVCVYVCNDIVAVWC